MLFNIEKRIAIVAGQKQNILTSKLTNNR